MVNIAHRGHGRQRDRADHRDTQHTSAGKPPPRPRPAGSVPRLRYLRHPRLGHGRYTRQVRHGISGDVRHQRAFGEGGTGDASLAATHERNSAADAVDFEHSAIASCAEINCPIALPVCACPRW